MKLFLKRKTFKVYFFLYVLIFIVLQFGLFKFLSLLKLLADFDIYDSIESNVDDLDIFENDFMNERFRDYMGKKILNDKSNFELRKFKRLMKRNENDERKKKKKFYLILEFTRVLSETKFCNMIIESDLYKNNKLFNQILNSNNRGDEFNKKSNLNYDILDKCSYKNCFFTCDKSFVNQADMLLFYESDLRAEFEKDVPEYNEESSLEAYYRKKLDFYRNPNQIWLLWSDESYRITKVLDQMYFNWTMSFHLLSDISFGAYGSFIRSNKKLIEKDYMNRLRSDFKNRRSESIWFVGDCYSKFRMDFALKLSNYFPTNIWGQCTDIIASLVKNEPKKYLNFKYRNTYKSCERGSICENTQFKSFKFYLAFENTNCSDFITEKFWRALDYDLIPIVIQPNKKNYEMLAPKNSFIHAEDFDFDPQKLGKYLEKVSNDFHLYASYFKWKIHFKPLYRAEDLEALRICELCFKLNNMKSLKYNSYYSNVSNWFNNQCKYD